MLASGVCGGHKDLATVRQGWAREAAKLRKRISLLLHMVETMQIALYLQSFWWSL